MEAWMIDLLGSTAWPMTAPQPGSAFHILFTLTGILIVIILAFYFRNRKGTSFYRVIFFCGVILACSEMYKQLFLYYIVNQGHYDWWYFPFQLCSLPMYLCLLIPFFHENAFGQVLVTFVKDFGLLGGVMALLEPSGLFHPYWTLTLHGLLWHLMLIFLSLFLTFADGGVETGRPMTGDACLLSYLQMLPLFGVFCLAATAINTWTRGAADMFYISPYYPVTQIVFDKISLRYGIGPGIMIYLLSVCLGGFLCHVALQWIVQRLHRRIYKFTML